MPRQGHLSLSPPLILGDFATHLFSYSPRIVPPTRESHCSGPVAASGQLDHAQRGVRTVGSIQAWVRASAHAIEAAQSALRGTYLSRNAVATVTKPESSTVNNTNPTAVG